MTHSPFTAADLLAPVPDEYGTVEDWMRHHAATARAACTMFRLQHDHDPGLMAPLGVASLHAAVALSSVHRGPLAQELYDLTPEAGALNGEWEEWLTETLD